MRKRLLGGALALLVLVPAAQAQQAPMLGSERGVGAQLPQDRSLAQRFATREEPPYGATPQAGCDADSRPETGIQGRVPAGSTDGFTCNVTLLGHEGSSGGYKAERYVDAAGHECAYYDSSLLAANNALTLGGTATGTVVLDMSDPTNPRRTDTLFTPAMLSPHESVLVNQERGLLAAVMGTPIFAPGFVDIYDISKDCRKPVLQSSSPVGLIGHESGWSKDGNTFYATSIGTGMITAVDTTNPKLPSILGVYPYASHGTTISDDGNRAYVAASGGLIILDTSELQSRKPNPQVHEVSRLTWERVSIPQNAQPFTVDGKPYLLETDEFASGGEVGAARIIDIADETQPRVVSNLRLAVHEPEHRDAVKGDPGQVLPVQGYAAHYCQVSSEVDPVLAACSMIASGLRLFDITDVTKPKEIGYFVAPPAPLGGNAVSDFEVADFAMSRPSIIPERREVWYSDGNSGFYAVRVDEAAWPTRGRTPDTAPRACRRAVRYRLAKRFVRAKVRGKTLRRRGGKRIKVRVVVRGEAGRRARVRIVARTKAGKRVVRVKRPRYCSRST